MYLLKSFLYRYDKRKKRYTNSVCIANEETFFKKYFLFTLPCLLTYFLLYWWYPYLNYVNIYTHTHKQILTKESSFYFFNLWGKIFEINRYALILRKEVVTGTHTHTHTSKCFRYVNFIQSLLIFFFPCACTCVCMCVFVFPLVCYYKRCKDFPFPGLFSSLFTGLCKVRCAKCFEKHYLRVHCNNISLDKLWWIPCSITRINWQIWINLIIGNDFDFIIKHLCIIYYQIHIFHHLFYLYQNCKIQPKIQRKTTYTTSKCIHDQTTNQDDNE